MYSILLKIISHKALNIIPIVYNTNYNMEEYSTGYYQHYGQIPEIVKYNFQKNLSTQLFS